MRPIAFDPEHTAPRLQHYGIGATCLLGLPAKTAKRFSSARLRLAGSTLGLVVGRNMPSADQLRREERQLAILGEGNTSVACGDGTFWVKASGSALGALDDSGVSRMRLEPMLELMSRDHLDELAIEEALLAAQADTAHPKPSVETFLHALCLSEGAARWVGHTHPIAVNQILCSRLGAEPFLRHLFPDAIVICGLLPAVVPYIDPGFALAKAVLVELRRYRAAHGQAPKLLLCNHGPVALGQSAREVLNIMLMADKWARILQGTYALGGPNFLSEREAVRIDSRLDEQYRRRRLSGGG